MVNWVFLLCLLVISGLVAATEIPLVVEHDTQPLKATVKLNGGELGASLGVSLPKARTVSPCKNNEGGCWQWSNGPRLDIQDDPRNVLCKTVVWTTSDPDVTLQDCWNLTENSFLYGGGSVLDQKWNVETEPLVDDPQVTGGDTDAGNGNSIHNRLWFSTMGVAFKVEDNVPLFVSVDQDNKQLCFKAAKISPYRSDPDKPLILSYNVCYGQDLTQLYMGVMPKFFKRPTDIPDERIFRSIVWNTWPKFKTDMNTNTLKEYVKNISEALGTAGSFLLIGPGWESCFGDHHFNSINFVQPEKFFKGFLKQNEMEASLWVHPQMSTRCESYNRDYFVTDIHGQVLFTQWEGNNVSTVDFTRPDAAAWWRNKLQGLVDKYGVTSFFFDHGQTSFLPKDYHFRISSYEEMLQQPDIYSTKYVELASTFGKGGFVNVGRNSQQYPLFVRMPEKLGALYDHDSLQSVIPSVLQMGINGFPFILPEVVGGSFYGNGLPDRKLYIRWLELSAFLPAMHLSVGPWEYDDEVLDITRKMFEHRSNYVETIIKLAHSSVDDGAPIIRPLWWISPNDNTTWMISDQFLVGNSLMVAPVVDDKEERDIYFPAGQWTNPLNKKSVSGPWWWKNYSVKLHEIAFFEKNSD